MPTRSRRSREMGSVGPKRPISVTTFRIYRDQHIALQREALERREAGTGRIDASAVLREILDAAGMRARRGA